MKSCHYIKLLLSTVLLLTYQYTIAQEPVVKKDSTRIYEKLDSLSSRNKTTKVLHDLVFRGSSGASAEAGKDSMKQIKPSYTTYEGKMVRCIYITTLDPFGFSIKDTTVTARSFFQKTGNSLHRKSRLQTIENLLLVKEGQPLDTLRLSESERLIREKKFIRDLSVTVVPVKGNAELVDLYFRILDTWSIIPKISANVVGLSDKNFLGLGHNFNNEYNKNLDYFYTSYTVENLGKTFISGSLDLGIDEHGHLNRRLSFNREFFSPLTKWAGGITLSHQSRTDTVGIDPTPTKERQFVVASQDVWAGSSFHLFKSSIEPLRSANFITTARVLRVRYPIKPTIFSDSENIFESENFYLGSIGFSHERYVKDRYLLKFGVTEDVPVGRVFNFTGGYQIKGDVERTYWGARLAFGNYHSWGYLATNFEYGSYFRKSNGEQGIVALGANYFTHLRKWGRWRFRQLIKPQITIGINPSVTDSLTLNNEFGIKGFNSPHVMGTRRLILTLQTQSYAPFNVFGFRLGPFLTWSGALLGDHENGFKKSKLYSQFGLGLLIRNEYLVLNAFQISVVFYPSMPGQGTNIFKINPFRTTDFTFSDYKIFKPAPVSYH